MLRLEGLYRKVRARNDFFSVDYFDKVASVISCPSTLLVHACQFGVDSHHERVVAPPPFPFV